MRIVIGEFHRREQADVLRHQLVALEVACFAPHEEACVQFVLEDFLLKPHKRASPFPVDSRHADAEQAHQTVSLVLDPGSLPGRRPRHTDRDTECEVRNVFSENPVMDPRDVLQKCGERRLHAQLLPIIRQKDDYRRGDELLECPSPRMPSTCSERGILLSHIAAAGDIGEVRVHTSAWAYH